MEHYNGWSPKERCATIHIQKEAVRTGAIPAPTTCSICGVTPDPSIRGAIGFHDEDYSNPLVAYSICRSCHMKLHRRFTSPGPWLALVARHSTGATWFEKLTMDPASRYRPFAETYPAGLPA